MVNLLQRYFAYLRDNPKRYWFKRKVYGWGWTPATWQGWITLALFLAICIWNFMRIDANSHSASDTLRPFIIQTLVLAVIFIIICHKKGESPKWQWGIPEDKEKIDR